MLRHLCGDLLKFDQRVSARVLQPLAASGPGANRAFQPAFARRAHAGPIESRCLVAEFYIYVRCWPGFGDGFPFKKFELLPDDEIGKALDDFARKWERANKQTIAKRRNRELAERKANIKMRQSQFVGAPTSDSRADAPPIVNCDCAVDPQRTEQLLELAKDSDTRPVAAARFSSQTRRGETALSESPTKFYHWALAPNGDPPNREPRAALIQSIGYFAGWVWHYEPPQQGGGLPVSPLTWLLKVPDQAFAATLLDEVVRRCKECGIDRMLGPRFGSVPVDRYPAKKRDAIELRIVTAKRTPKVTIDRPEIAGLTSAPAAAAGRRRRFPRSRASPRTGRRRRCSGPGPR
jgi:hypothetical protein